MIWTDSEKEEESEKAEEISQKSESDEEESDKKISRILTTKEKIIESLKSIHNSIRSSINSQNYKTILEKLEDFQKIIEKVLSSFKKEEIPAYFYESFALMEDLTNISKEDKKKLSGENNNYLNNIKKGIFKLQKKMGNEYKEYKNTNRKKEEKDLEEDLNKIEEYRKKKQEDEESKTISKKTKKKR